MALAFVFPGQGSQAVGMGKGLAEAFASARLVFEEVDEVLGERLSRLIWEGPEETLTLTANAQPALMAVSLAAVRALEAEFGVRPGAAACLAGHSLGEYSALAAAGALTLADTARLLRLRGRAMQNAVAPGQGAMAALLGASLEQAEAAAAAGAALGVCEIANDNAEGQVVLSGAAAAAVEAALAHARADGVRKAMLLNVSAPFHCALMAPAAAAMEEALAGTEIAPPAAPIVANVTAAPVTAPAEIRALLVAQVTGRVRWRESVAAMAALGAERLVEIGSGKVLSVMARRIEPALPALALQTPQELEAFAKELGGGA